MCILLHGLKVKLYILDSVIWIHILFFTKYTYGHVVTIVFTCNEV